MKPLNYPPRYALYPGQGPLRRFSFFSLAQAVPGAAALFAKQVPAEYWHEEARMERDGHDPSTSGRVATISCVCGARPRATENKLSFCKGSCGRVFVLLGDTVHVARFEPQALAEGV